MLIICYETGITGSCNISADALEARLKTLEKQAEAIDWAKQRLEAEGDR